MYNAGSQPHRFIYLGRTEVTNVHFSGHSGYTPRKQTIRHGSVEEQGHDTAVQNAGISLMRSAACNQRRNGPVVRYGKPHIQTKPVITVAENTLGVIPAAQALNPGYNGFSLDIQIGQGINP